MIDQRRHGLDEAHGVRQRGVEIERGFVDPARVDVEQPGITRRRKASIARQPGSARLGGTTSRIAAAASASLPSWTWKRTKMKKDIVVLHDLVREARSSRAASCSASRMFLRI